MHEDRTFPAIDIPRIEIHPIQALREAAALLGKQYWLFVLICFLGMLIGGVVPFGILMGPMMAGIFLCFIRREEGEPVTIDLLFRGFDFFVESLIATLLTMAATLVGALPLMIAGMVMFAGIAATSVGAATSGSDAAAATVVTSGVGATTVAVACLIAFSVLIMFAVVCLLTFTIPLVVDQRMKAFDAVLTSYEAVRINFGGVFLLTIFLGVINIVATLFCYVPSLLVMPLSLGAIFVVYRRLFPDSQLTFDDEGMPVRPGVGVPA